MSETKIQVFEDLIHEALESLGRISQAKGHVRKFEKDTFRPFRVPDTSRPEGRVIHLHSAAPPPHEPTTPNPGNTACIPKNLQDSTHVFLRQDTIRRALEPPYSGPHKVLARNNKTLKIVVRGREITVSADRVKPAYLLENNLHDNGNPPNQPRSVPAKPDAAPSLPPRTTRSGIICSGHYRE